MMWVSRGGVLGTFVVYSHANTSQVLGTLCPPHALTRGDKPVCKGNVSDLNALSSQISISAGPRDLISSLCPAL